MKIGPQVEEISGGDLTRHHRGSSPTLLSRGDQAAELADAHPVDLIHKASYRGIRFSLEGCCDHTAHARLARPLHCKQRVGAVAGDEKECLWLLHKPEG